MISGLCSGGPDWKLNAVFSKLDIFLPLGVSLGRHLLSRAQQQSCSQQVVSHRSGFNGSRDVRNIQVDIT